MAPAVAPGITARTTHKRDPSESPPFPLPPPALTETVARKWKSHEHPESFDATISLSDNRTTSILQNENNEPLTSV